MCDWAKDGSGRWRGPGSIMLLGLKVGDDQRLSLIFSGDQV